MSTLRREYLSADDGAGTTARGSGAAGEQAAALDGPGPGTVVYEDPYHTVHKLGVRFRDAEREYRVIECGSRAGVLPVRGDEILLVRQFRLLANGLTWEIPGGKVEAGETPREAAIRECFEETGVVCRNLRTLAGYHPGMDTFCNPTYLYYADDISEGAAADRKGETVERAWFPLPAVLGMIRSLQLVDAFTMIGVLTYHLQRERQGRAFPSTEP